MAFTIMNGMQPAEGQVWSCCTMHPAAQRLTGWRSDVQALSVAQPGGGSSVTLPAWPPPGECQHEGPGASKSLGNMLSHLVAVHTAYRAGKVRPVRLSGCGAGCTPKQHLH